MWQSVAGSRPLRASFLQDSKFFAHARVLAAKVCDKTVARGFVYVLCKHKCGSCKWPLERARLG